MPTAISRGRGGSENYPQLRPLSCMAAEVSEVGVNCEKSHP